MNLLAILPIIFSGILGMVCEFVWHIEFPGFYWMLGSMGMLGAWGVCLLV